ncbi:hypothetical protein [Sulfurimonas indica]|uniref:hypothetical protein n=1 Tax=Sulfurimonas indica TaxID=2508707 RepID=UPI00165FE578|nr:hypothetical protein [Sulfurimonas indica]
MHTVYEGTLESCLAFIRSEEENDETLCFDLVQSNISDTLFYVKELDGYDTYEGSY